MADGLSPAVPMSGYTARKVIVEGQELLAYDAVRQKLRQRMRSLGHGAQRDCSFDMRVSTSSISNVLVGRQIDSEILRMIEMWLDSQRDKDRKYKMTV